MSSYLDITETGHAALCAYMGIEPHFVGRTIAAETIAVASLAQSIGIVCSEYGTPEYPRLDLLSVRNVRLALHRAGRRRDARMIGAWQRAEAYADASASLAGASSLTHTYALLAAAGPRDLAAVGTAVLADLVGRAQPVSAVETP